MENHLITRRALLAVAAATPLMASNAPDICFLSAVEMAGLIRKKKLSAREAMTAHLKQIERVNPRVNAIVTLVAERALENARKADEAQAHGAPLGPLHGLPIAHKDLVETAGILTTFGSPIFRDNVPERDAILVESIRKAGAILLGKTNTPEFGAGSQTFNAVFGSTRNPHDLTKTCGGSSGGAATAVACGMLPFADGSDSGGSLRNPPAFCGVVGLRPSPGRVASAARGNPWLTIGVSGPVARNVPDLALLLSAMAGPDPRSPISIMEPGSRFTANLGRSFKGVRVAWFRDMGGLPFDRRILETVNAQRRVFENLGCIVEEAEPDWTGAHEGYDILRAWGYLVNQGQHVRLHRELVKDTVIWEVERGQKLSASDIARAHALRADAWDKMRIFQEKYEYLITPTTQVLPFDVNQPYPTQIEGVKMSTYIEWQKSCILISALENPALSIPCGFTGDGLPVGLQIIGRHRDDWSVLQLANAYEQATPTLRRRPAIAA